MFVLRRPAGALGMACYYPPGAAVHAQWTSPEEAESFRVTLDHPAAWHVLSTSEARGLDKRDAKEQSDAAIRQVLREMSDIHIERAIDETPGDLMSYPIRRGSDIVQVPVVAIQRIGEGPAAGTVVKMPDGNVVHLPLDWALDDEPADAWREHLAAWRAGGFSYTAKGGAR